MFELITSICIAWIQSNLETIKFDHFTSLKFEKSFIYLSFFRLFAHSAHYFHIHNMRKYERRKLWYAFINMNVFLSHYDNDSLNRINKMHEILFVWGGFSPHPPHCLFHSVAMCNMNVCIQFRHQMNFRRVHFGICAYVCELAIHVQNSISTRNLHWFSIHFFLVIVVAVPCMLPFSPIR